MAYTSLRKRFRSLPFRCNLGFGSRVLSFTTSILNARWENYSRLFARQRSDDRSLRLLELHSRCGYRVLILAPRYFSTVFTLSGIARRHSHVRQFSAKCTQSTWFRTKAMADRVNAYKYLCRQPLRKTCTLVLLDWKWGLYSLFRCGSRPHNIDISNSLWSKLPAFGLSTMWRHAHLSSVPPKSEKWPRSRRQCSHIALFYSIKKYFSERLDTELKFSCYFEPLSDSLRYYFYQDW